MSTEGEMWSEVLVNSDESQGNERCNDFNFTWIKIAEF